MKCIRNLSILLLVASFLVPTAEAQVLKRLKDRAKQRLEDRAEQKAEDAVDKAVDQAAEGAENAARAALERRTAARELNLGPNATGPANAPYVKYRSTTSVNLGAIGAVARLLGKDIENMTETVWLTENRQRSDVDKQSTIIDLDGSRFIMLNHDKRQYSAMTFDAMMQQMDAAAREVKAEAASSSSSSSDVQGDVSFDLSVDRTGGSDTINGSAAEQVVLTIRSDFELKGTNDDGEQEEVRGTMYALIDSWITNEIAGIKTMEAFQQRMGEQMGASFKQSDLGTTLAALTKDPRLTATMEKAAEEMKNLDGIPVWSTMHIIIVPEGQPLDVELALRPRAEARRGLAGLVQAAENAEKEGEAPQQATLLSITTQISDLQVEPFPDSDFEVPSGYAEVSMF